MHYVCVGSPPISCQSCILRVLQRSFWRYWWSSLNPFRVCLTSLPTMLTADSVSPAPAWTSPCLHMVACFEIRQSCYCEDFTSRKMAKALLLFWQHRKVLLTRRCSPRAKDKERSTTQHRNSAAFSRAFMKIRDTQCNIRPARI